MYVTILVETIDTIFQEIAKKFLLVVQVVKDNCEEEGHKRVKAQGELFAH